MIIQQGWVDCINLLLDIRLTSNLVFVVEENNGSRPAVSSNGRRQKCLLPQSLAGALPGKQLYGGYPNYIKHNLLH